MDEDEDEVFENGEGLEDETEEEMEGEEMDEEMDDVNGDFSQTGASFPVLEPSFKSMKGFTNNTPGMLGTDL